MKKAFMLIMGIFVMFSCKNESKTNENNDTLEDKSVHKSEHLAGGWSEVPVEDDVKEALDFALKEINPTANLKKVIRAKKQVVKGLNYDLALTLENGETWNVQVYRDLEGNLSLTKKAKNPMPGGWSEMGITPEVEDAVDFVLSRMNHASPLKEILSAKSQVVRGVNYEVSFSLENNSVWTAKVHRDLDGKFMLLQEPESK
ncbi:MAG: cystatin domain-containing protein [Robiginitalea sp.]|nr:cystatin domain-containing protein [Robiginitalea sp.]